jgi:hypothetical protein
MQSKRMTWWLAGVALSVAVFPLAAAARGGRAAAPSLPTAAASRAEPHPEIRRAIAALNRAKAYLQHAAHDFGGHRVEAIEAIDRALAQLNMALQYDKK